MTEFPTLSFQSFGSFSRILPSGDLLPIKKVLVYSRLSKMKRDAAQLQQDEEIALEDRRVRRLMEKEDVASRRAESAAQKSAVKIQNLVSMSSEWKSHRLSPISLAELTLPAARHPGTPSPPFVPCPSPRFQVPRSFATSYPRGIPPHLICSISFSIALLQFVRHFCTFPILL